MRIVDQVPQAFIERFPPRSALPTLRPRTPLIRQFTDKQPVSATHSDDEAGCRLPAPRLTQDLTALGHRVVAGGSPRAT